jgi:hypothetical protein
MTYYSRFLEDQATGCRITRRGEKPNIDTDISETRFPSWQARSRLKSLTHAWRMTCVSQHPQLRIYSHLHCQIRLLCCYKGSDMILTLTIRYRAFICKVGGGGGLCTDYPVGLWIHNLAEGDTMKRRCLGDHITRGDKVLIPVPLVVMNGIWVYTCLVADQTHSRLVKVNRIWVVFLTSYRRRLGAPNTIWSSPFSNQRTGSAWWPEHNFVSETCTQAEEET